MAFIKKYKKFLLNIQISNHGLLPGKGTAPLPLANAPEPLNKVLL
jgi:hypothetical protein